MSHPSACGVSADDVAVLVHGDLLAIGQGHSIAAIADALGRRIKAATARRWVYN